jgi:hypothetical protein
LFIDRKEEIIKNINLQAKKLFNLKILGLNKIATDLNRINFIFLHYSEMNMNNIMQNLQQKIINSNVFEFLYVNTTKKNKNFQLFSSTNPEYEKLVKFNKNCVNIFIFEYDDIYFIPLLNELCNNIATNYLSYLFIFNHNSTREIDISYFDIFHKNHIYFFLYSNEILKEIIIKFEKIQSQMKKNYSLYLTNRVKYNSIINEYNKLYKYEIFVDKEDKKYSDLEDIIEQYKDLFVEKIKQDLCFYLTLSLKDKNKIEISFKSDLFKIIDEDSAINDFLDENTLINDFKTIVCNFLNVLFDNNNDEQFNDTFKKDDDILTVNGIPYIFQSNNTKDEDKNDKSIFSPKNQINEFNNFLKSLQNVDSDKKKKVEDFRKYAQVSLLSDEIKNNLRLSLKIINIKLFYRFFMSVVLKSIGD